MRFKCLTVALACCLLATAQEVTITRHEQLLKGVESGIYNPVLSADGQKVLFTASNYKGLKMYDMQDDVVTRLSDDQMAGFDPVFSRDGKSVYFMSQTRENMRVYREMKSASLDGKTTAVVVEKARGMRSPVAIDGGLAVVSDKGRTVVSKQNGGTYVYAQGAELVVVRNGVENASRRWKRNTLICGHRCRPTDRRFCSMPERRVPTCAISTATCLPILGNMWLRNGWATIMWWQKMRRTTGINTNLAKSCF